MINGFPFDRHLVGQSIAFYIQLDSLQHILWLATAIVAVQAQRHVFCHNKDDLALIWLHVLCVMQFRAQRPVEQYVLDGCLRGHTDISFFTSMNILVFLHLYVETPVLTVMISGGRAFGRQLLGCESRIRGEICNFIRRGRDITLTLGKWLSVCQGESSHQGFTWQYLELGLPGLQDHGKQVLMV